jgi:Protein of unknown function (DUF2868)
LNPVARHSSFQDATITEAIRLVEENGPLDDEQAMRQAGAKSGEPADRIVERALILGGRIGLADDMSRARAWAPWVLLGLVALVVLAGLALAGQVLGNSERQINVVLALASLLGLHLCTLLLWLVGLVLPTGSFQVSFGWLWAALTTRVAAGRSGQTPVLLRAMTRLLARARLLPWALGLASHLVWTLSFAVVLAAMLFALSFRSYTLNWETTILEPDFFVRSVQGLGRLPGWLGFPVPDAQAIRAPLSAAAGQRAWALWLTGCILVYGFMPRLLFALLCATLCRRRRAALQPDLAQPYFRKLMARFEALEPRRIVDADPGRAPQAAPLPARDGTGPVTGAWAIGFELPDELPWPPAELGIAATQVLRIDGSAGSRRQLLDLLARTHAQQVLIGCRAAASPDRGTERFLRGLMAQCSDCRLLLVGAADDEAADRRWRGWLSEASLDGLLARQPAEALQGGSA